MSPTQPAGDADEPRPVAAYTDVNVRTGLWLFALYLAFYAGFVGLSAFAPGLMSRTPLGGLNAAILYGMFLIVAAFGLALVYMALCRRNAGKGGPR